MKVGSVEDRNYITLKQKGEFSRVLGMTQKFFFEIYTLCG